jgi:hypothetical protein
MAGAETGHFVIPKALERFFQLSGLPIKAPL